MKANSYNDSEGYMEEEEEPKHVSTGPKKGNVLPLWGNERTMNLNPLILTNIQSSHYFKVNLYELKTYHEVIDEIYYKVAHLEPWEKGSRKTAGQTGMCGGVRGVGAGGIVSTAYCLLYKLFTLKLTRKQLNGLITHPDSPYIRALGFMYVRYTQPPADLWDWYDEYLDDDEELDVKAGGGQTMTMGNILKNFLCKLEWFSTLFPRIPVPIQQKIQRNMEARFPGGIGQKAVAAPSPSLPRFPPEPEVRYSDKRERGYDKVKASDSYWHDDRVTRPREREGKESRERERGGKESRERERGGRESRGRETSRERERKRHGSRERHHRKRSHDRKKHRSRSRSRTRAPRRT